MIEEKGPKVEEAHKKGRGSEKDCFLRDVGLANGRAHVRRLLMMRLGDERCCEGMWLIVRRVTSRGFRWGSETCG